ncbi:MAG: pilus assembly protein CpaB [Clostridiales bacterium]|nr:pilus assembly protein CpaB [Clostridiales bacterium]MDN5282378.1 pilus assembly protein CpaB [Candidatus Ozemobacter sp.]
MNRRAIFVALIASLAISMLLWNKLQKSTPPEPKPPVVEQPTILKKPVVVSTKRLAARTRLEPEIVKQSFEIREIIASAVPDTAFTDLASITNRYTAITILPDDIMTPGRLLDEASVPNLARAIPPGKRAVSIAVSKVSSVGGFIQQGDFVDVIATFRPRNSVPITKIVLQDIQVLAVGGKYEFSGATASQSPAISASKVELITLAVTPSELERLMYLDTGTSFRFVLKNPQDKDRKIHTKGATERTVLSDIGHPDYVQTQPISVSTSSTETVKEPVIIEPVDDGKVEIMYGATVRREIYKYGGPAAAKFRRLPDQQTQNVYSPPTMNIPSAESGE